MLAGQLEYASKQLLIAVHANTGGYNSSIINSNGGMLITLDEMASSYWSDSPAGGYCCIIPHQLDTTA